MTKLEWRHVPASLPTQSECYYAIDLKNNLRYVIYKSKKEHGWGLQVLTDSSTTGFKSYPLDSVILRSAEENYWDSFLKIYAQKLHDLINREDKDEKNLLDIEVKKGVDVWKSAYAQDNNDIQNWLKEGYVIRIKSI